MLPLEKKSHFHSQPPKTVTNSGRPLYEKKGGRISNFICGKQNY